MIVIVVAGVGLVADRDPGLAAAEGREAAQGREQLAGLGRVGRDGRRGRPRARRRPGVTTTPVSPIQPSGRRRGRRAMPAAWSMPRERLGERRILAVQRDRCRARRVAVVVAGGEQRWSRRGAQPATAVGPVRRSVPGAVRHVRRRAVHDERVALDAETRRRPLGDEGQHRVADRRRGRHRRRRSGSGRCPRAIATSTYRKPMWSPSAAAWAASNAGVAGEAAVAAWCRWRP